MATNITENVNEYTTKITEADKVVWKLNGSEPELHFFSKSRMIINSEEASVDKGPTIAKRVSENMSTEVTVNDPVTGNPVTINVGTLSRALRAAFVEFHGIDNALSPEAELSALKAERVAQIDEKTRFIILQGTTFDGHVFSQSPVAQINWTGLNLAIQAGYITEAHFPYTVTTLDSGSYVLEWADRDAFFQTLLAGISIPIAEGRAIKTAVTNATTIEEVIAVVDER